MSAHLWHGEKIRRSDAAASFSEGENLVISLLREQKATFAEPFDGFTFTRFDGSKVKV